MRQVEHRSDAVPAHRVQSHPPCNEHPTFSLPSTPHALNPGGHLERWMAVRLRTGVLAKAALQGTGLRPPLTLPPLVL